MDRTGRRVVVTGLGLVTPLGIGVEPNWKALIAGESGIGPITLFDASKLGVRIAGEVKGFRAEDFIERKEARRMDRFAQLAMAASAMAIEQSGLQATAENAQRIAVIIGSQFGGLGSIEETYRKALEQGPDRVSPFFILQALSNLASGYISIRHGFMGPSYATSSACSSSAHSLGEAMRGIERGEYDAAVAGGAEAPVTLLSVAGFHAMGALSTRNDAPQAASRPFDKDRDGFVLAEGSGVLVLEAEEVARRRGAKILAVLTGYGASSDAHHVTTPRPEHEGSQWAMRSALADAGLAPADIGYLNAHGTSTPVGDVREMDGVKAVFGADASNLAVSSTKSMTGHLNGAAGAAEAVISVLALQREVLPPTINLDHQDPAITLDCIALKARPKRVDAVMTNSFGFGGTNVSLIFRRWTA